MIESRLSPALAWSGALQRQLMGMPDFGDWLVHAAALPVSLERLSAWFLELAGVPAQSATLDLAQCRSVLRQLRRRTFFVTMVRDIHGDASLEEVTGAMSASYKTWRQCMACHARQSPAGLRR